MSKKKKMMQKMFKYFKSWKKLFEIILGMKFDLKFELMIRFKIWMRDWIVTKDDLFSMLKKLWTLKYHGKLLSKSIASSSFA